MAMPLLDKLRVVLEHSHNAYTFSYRCRGLMINIERQPDNSIVAYYSDDRDGQVTLDTSQPPFDRIKFFYRQ
jgi:hypothetical protein